MSNACKKFGKQKENLYKTSGVVVSEVIAASLDPKKLNALQHIETLKRTVRRHKERLRPKCPLTLDTPLLMDHIPAEFLIGDVQFGGQRHLLFATPEQIQVYQFIIYYLLRRHMLTIFRFI